MFKTFEDMKIGEQQNCPVCKKRREKGFYFLSRKNNSVRNCDICEDKKRGLK